FSVIEQRPAHISLLPVTIATTLYDQHRAVLGNEGYVPPRQGPFNFFLIVPRAGRRTEDVDTIDWLGSIVAPVEHLPTKDKSPIELQGNLMSRIHFIREGEAQFICDPANINMSFEKNQIFGQLELSGNYVAGRVFGWLGPKTDLISVAVSSPDLRSH